MKNIIILFPYIGFLLSCSFNFNDCSIVHVNQLTDIDSFNVGHHTQINRDDNFIVYNFHQTKRDSLEIYKYARTYSDSFSKKYDNYRAIFYKESKFADTIYVKDFGTKYAYKALLDEKPLMEFQWWSGRLLTAPNDFKLQPTGSSAPKDR